MALTVVQTNPGTLTSVGAISGGVQGQGGIPNNANKITVPGVSAKTVSNNTATPTTSTASTTPTAPVYQDKSGDISAQNAFLANAPTALNTSLGALQGQQSTLDQNYADETNAANTAYNNEVGSNKTDLEQNKETALQNAVQGRQGLFGTMAALGALNGTGITLANNAIATGANQDLTAASDNYATNAAALDNSLKPYLSQVKKNQQQDDSSIANSEKTVRYQNAKDTQAAYDALANDYTAEGNTGAAAQWTAKANALAPTIALSSAPTLPTLTGGQNATWSAPSLQSYIGKANDTTVKGTPGPVANNPLNVPGLIAAAKKQG